MLRRAEDSSAAEINAACARVYDDFKETPWLTVTVAQGCRLWGLDERTCALALQSLAQRGLIRHEDNTYIGKKMH